LTAVFPAEFLKENVIADNLGAAATDHVDEKVSRGQLLCQFVQRIGFSDFAHGDWRLLATSKTRKRASDGGDPGVNLDALIAARGDGGARRAGELKRGSRLAEHALAGRTNFELTTPIFMADNFENTKLSDKIKWSMPWLLRYPRGAPLSLQLAFETSVAQVT
jgi:hypothetical protein